MPHGASTICNTRKAALLSTRCLHAGIHILLLYLWQIDLVRRVMWQGASKCLGLYHMHQGEPADLLAAQVYFTSQFVKVMWSWSCVIVAVMVVLKQNALKMCSMAQGLQACR